MTTDEISKDSDHLEELIFQGIPEDEQHLFEMYMNDHIENQVERLMEYSTNIK
ncbi:MAG: hypothetical protein WCP32_11880 [Bacteroidota bacterium]